MSVTATFHVGHADYVVDRAQVLSREDTAAVVGDWNVEESSPFLTWIAGDFVEADNPNSNKQFWTAGDLELAEYTIRYSPLNMVHKFRTPIGFFAETRKVQLARVEKPRLTTVPSTMTSTAGAATTTNGTDSGDTAAAVQGSMKIQALSGLWSHIFPFESALVEAANDGGTLFYSMECRGSKLTCSGDSGCGETFDYMKPETHCAHLLERSSVRHIVDPVFRGGALIVPPTKPGWKEARAGIVSDAVLQEAAVFAEQNEAAYQALEADGVTMTVAGWEQLMSMVVGMAAAEKGGSR